MANKKTKPQQERLTVMMPVTLMDRLRAVALKRSASPPSVVRDEIFILVKKIVQELEHEEL